MLHWFINCLYNCCFGVKKTRKTDKIHNAMYAIEDLSKEEFNKLMNIYNNKCC